LDSPLIARLKRSEGWRPYLYLDTTGHATIGFGHNLGRVLSESPVTIAPVNGISQEIGEQLLHDDVAAVIQQLESRLVWFQCMDEVRREVLIELGFNIGTGKVLSYPVFMDQLERQAYLSAAENMRSWAWYRQVGVGRAEPLCRMLETGVRE